VAQVAEPVEIIRDRTTYFMLAALSVLIMVGCVVVLATGAAESGNDRFLSLLGIPFLIGVALFFAYLGVNRTPALVIDSSGIKGAGVRRLAWDEIERISVVEVADTTSDDKSLVLQLVQGHRAEPATRAHVFRLGGNVAKASVVKLSLKNLVLLPQEVVAEVERLSGRTVEWKEPNWRDLIPRRPRKPS
jgi:hypothetical protein